MVRSWPVWLLLWLAVVGGCTTAPADDIVLQTGGFMLTEDELQDIRNQGPYRELTDAQLAERLVDEARMLAFAQQHRFDTLSLLQRRLEYAMRYQVSSVNGYLWNRQVKPLLRVSQDEVKKTYNLRAQEYWLEYVFFPDERDFPAGLHSAGGDVAAALKRGARAAGVEVFSGWRSFPFVPLAVYLPALAQPEVGKLYGPVKTLHGYCVVYIKEKRPAERSFAADSAAIEGELLLALQEAQIWKSQQQVMQMTQPVWQEDAIAATAAAFRPADRSWPGVADSLVLMKYSWQGLQRPFTLAHLQELVQCQPLFMGSLQVAADVRKLLESHLIGLCLYQKAKELGMEQDPAFRLQQQRYLRGLYIQHYKQVFVYPRLSVTDEAVAAAYPALQSSVRCFGNARVAWYDFADLPSALAARQSMATGAPVGKTVAGAAHGRLPAGKEVTIAGADTLYGKALFDAVNRLAPGGWSMPVQESDRFVVLQLKEKQGHVQASFKYAADDIRQQLLARQERALLDALATAFPLHINRLDDWLSGDNR